MSRQVISHPASGARAQRPGLTVAQLRRLIDHLPDDTEVVVGVCSGRHFNELIGELQVVEAQLSGGVPHSTVVLHVQGYA